VDPAEGIIHTGTLSSDFDGESADGTGSREVPERLVADMAGQLRDQSSQQNETQGAKTICAQGPYLFSKKN